MNSRTDDSNLIAVARLSADNGKFKAGDIVRGTSIDGVLQCIHDHCHMSFPDDSNLWFEHIESYHSTEDPSPSANHAELDQGISNGPPSTTSSSIEITNFPSTTLSNDCGMFKTGDVLSSEWINGVLGCPHANCNFETSLESNWHNHVRSTVAHRSGSQNVSVTLRKNVDELKKGHTLTADCINGIFKCVRDNCDMETKSKSGWIRHVQSPHTLLVTLKKDVGKLKKGAKLRAHRTKIGFECAHVDCPSTTSNKSNWINHVHAWHKSSNPDEVESSASGTSAPTYLKDPFILKSVRRLQFSPPSVRRLQFLPSSVRRLEFFRSSAFQSNPGMAQYEQICNYYFQSRQNSLLTEEMSQIRQKLVDSDILVQLPDHDLLLQYKSIFTEWVTTMIKLKDNFPLDFPLQASVGDIHESAKKYHFMQSSELASQEQAYYDSDHENTSSETWPGAHPSDALYCYLESIHSFLNVVITDYRLPIAFDALTLLLSDSVENGRQVWKPANEAKKILDALRYSIILQAVTQFKINNTFDIVEYMHSFFGPKTQTFALPLSSLLSNIS